MTPWMATALAGALALTVACVLSVMIVARRIGVVPMPSSRSLRRLIVGVLAGYGHVSTVTDLGSGWGGLALRIARSLPGCRVVAVERSPVPLFVSRTACALVRARNLCHVRGDVSRLALRDAEAYVCYLSGAGMRRLRESFERDLPRGGVLVSAVFAMPGWTPSRVLTARDLFRSRVYVYEF